MAGPNVSISPGVLTGALGSSSYQPSSGLRQFNACAAGHAAGAGSGSGSGSEDDEDQDEDGELDGGGGGGGWATLHAVVSAAIRAVIQADALAHDVSAALGTLRTQVPAVRAADRHLVQASAAA